MSKIAIAIAILPPKDIIDATLSVNKRAVEKGEAKIELGETDRIPHISLLMGVVDDKNFEELTRKLKDIAENFESIKMESNRIENGCFTISKNEKLQNLHEMIVKKIDPILTHETSPKMFYESSPSHVSDSALRVVKEYVNNFSLKNFWPHITIHSSEENPSELPLSFTADRLAICHLGTYCTCRKILFETKLTK